MFSKIQNCSSVLKQDYQTDWKANSKNMSLIFENSANDYKVQNIFNMKEYSVIVYYLSGRLKTLI